MNYCLFFTPHYRMFHPRTMIGPRKGNFRAAAYYRCVTRSKIVYHPAKITEWLLPKFFSLLIDTFQTAGLAECTRHPRRCFCEQRPNHRTVSRTEKVES
jgi:hypothetical protein